MKKKGMTGKDYFALAFGSMIGIGWLVSAPLWIANAGSVGAMIAMLLTALIVIPIGFVYSELCTSVKIVGGEFAYAYQFLGRLPGFCAGWFLILGYVSMLPWVVLSTSSMLNYLFPQIQTTLPLYTILGNTLHLPEIIIGLVMIWGITLINLRGMQSSKKFQNVATGVLLLTFALFFICSFIFGDIENLKPAFSAKGAGSGILMAIASMIFFMNGFDTIPKAADEMDKDINARNLAKALVGTILMGSFIYILVILCSSLIMNPGESVNLGALPLVTSYELATGSKALGFIMVLGALMGVLTTFNGFLMAGAKFICSFADAGFMGKALGSGSSEKHIPRRALLILAALATAGMFMGKGLLAPLITMGGITFLIVWMIMGIANWRYRAMEPDAPRPFRVPGGKAVILLAIVICAALIAMMVIPGTLISLGIVENILLIGWIAIGIVVYIVYRGQSIQIKKNFDRKE
ncbi:APC family permease [Emergencia sp.]|uniref:APC family permease n=1 Tax=Emergencia sp. TaxID=1926557 RepID=UPI003AF0D40D